jgi:hypothetical protein
MRHISTHFLFKCHKSLSKHNNLFQILAPSTNIMVSMAACNRVDAWFIFSLLHSILTSSGSHPTYLMGTGASFPGDKAARACSWTFAYITRKVKNGEAIPVLPPYAFMAWCLINEGQGQVYLTILLTWSNASAFCMATLESHLLDYLLFEFGQDTA